MGGRLLLGGAVAANQERIIICIQINNTVDGVVVATTRNAKTTSTSANSTDDGENTWLNGILDEVAPLRCILWMYVGIYRYLLSSALLHNMHAKEYTASRPQNHHVLWHNRGSSTN